MLPDFPLFKYKIRNSAINSVWNIMNDDPIKSSSRKKIQFEGGGFSHYNLDGERIKKDFTRVGTELTISDDEILDKGILIYLEKMVSAGEEMSKQTTEILTKEIGEAAASVGNTASFNSEQTIDEMMYEMIEKMEIDFDDDGNPYMPILVTGSKAYNTIYNKIRKNPKSQKCNSKMEELLKIKKEEFDVRESNRKLVD
ncbi:hypothetical protein [Methanobrevibacter arboriphilus]|uniref:hypothetical protein n=1 Tax=Methanobrevibacter arboriphilus TaxID=39441 RepID=UPI0005B2621E|nr:hypothetical protein [Methanobrevibacter arboriphilus]